MAGYVDDNFSGRDWNLASAMVINKEAGMQLGRLKGEFLRAGQTLSEEFCARFPGTAGAVTFNSDQFMMFKSVKTVWQLRVKWPKPLWILRSKARSTS